MSIAKIFILVLLAFLINNNLFFKLPIKNTYLDAFVKTCLFFILLLAIDLVLAQKEGYTNSQSLFEDPQESYDYCIETNRPPFMGSMNDTINYCLDRISGKNYVPKNLKPAKKVRFAC